jgi:hypothetical protein
MSPRRLITVLGLLLLSGCLYQVRQETDRVVSELAAQPYDLQPPDKSAPSKPASSSEKSSAKPSSDTVGSNPLQRVGEQIIGECQPAEAGYYNLLVSRRPLISLYAISRFLHGAGLGLHRRQLSNSFNTSARSQRSR